MMHFNALSVLSQVITHAERATTDTTHKRFFKHIQTKQRNGYDQNKDEMNVAFGNFILQMLASVSFQTHFFSVENQL
jgi:uncharacterized protein YbcI